MAALHEKAAGSWAALGQRATLVRDKLAEAHDTRCQWEAMTEPTRRLARAVDIELKRRGVLSRDDRLHSAEPEGFAYPERERARHVWGSAAPRWQHRPSPRAQAARPGRAGGTSPGSPRPHTRLRPGGAASSGEPGRRVQPRAPSRDRRAAVNADPGRGARRNGPPRSLERACRTPPRRRYPAAQAADPSRRRRS